MPGSRKEPRLNLRFADHDIMDEIELIALKLGLSLHAWIKQLIFREIRNLQAQNQTEDTALKRLLMIQGLVETKSTEKEIEDTKARVETYFERVKKHAAGKD